VTNVVDSVVARDLCSGCGVCAGVCPRGVLSMDFRSDGDLVPSLQGECSSGCDLCLRVCPFLSGVYDPRPLNERLFGSGSERAAVFHHHIGWYCGSLVGYSKLDEHRSAGASGGLATWALESLLRDKIIDKAAVVTRSHGDKRLFRFSVATTEEEVRRASGSVYYPVEVSDILKLMLGDRLVRWAVVGVPCLVHAVRRAAIETGRIGKQAKVLFGLCCGMLQNRYYTELLMAAAGVKPSDARSIVYRGKSPTGDPANYLFSATNAEGVMSRQIPYRGLPSYLGHNAYFRHNACNYCMDVFAEAADACFMDAWLPEYKKEPKGTSIVVARSRAMEELFERGVALGELNVSSIDAERVWLSQSGQIRRKRVLIGVRLGALYERQQGGNLGVVAWSPEAAPKDRVDWWLQRRAQRRSKRAWSRWGVRYGLTAFWLSMSDLIILNAALGAAIRVGSNIKSLVSGLRNRARNVMSRKTHEKAGSKR
jgi:coenzyme F420 hydrogenase subunit beta